MRLPHLILALTCCLAARLTADTADLRIAHVRYDGTYWQIWEMDGAGQNARPLTTSPSDKRALRAIPGQRALLFRDNQGHLSRLDLANGQVTEVRLPAVEVIKDFDFDPARGYLLSTYAPNANDNIRIWWYSADGTQRRLVIADPHLNEMPRWMPATNRFLFVKAHRGMSRICRGTLPHPASEDLLSDPFAAVTEPAPAPDGRQIVYCRESENNLDLWLARSDGSQPRRLYAGPGLDSDPCWSPDGTHVFFVTWDGQHFRIASLSLDATVPRLLSPDHLDCRYPVAFASKLNGGKP